MILSTKLVQLNVPCTYIKAKKMLKKKLTKNRQKPTTFFNPKIDSDPDRKPKLEKKSIPIPTDVKKSIPLGYRGNPSMYYPGSTLLDFGDKMGIGMYNVSQRLTF
jgi:hypothetical protein